MSQRKSNRTKRVTSYQYLYISYEEQPFDPNEYVDNLAMIKKLHEERKMAYSASVSLQGQLEGATMNNQQLELQRQELDIKLHTTQKEVDRLQEEKRLTFSEISSLRDQLEDSRKYTHQLEIQKREHDIEIKSLKDKLDKNKRASLLENLVSIGAAILLGFGVNIVTTKPYDWEGWLIITSSVILAIIVFFMHGREADG